MNNFSSLNSMVPKPTKPTQTVFGFILSQNVSLYIRYLSYPRAKCNPCHFSNPRMRTTMGPRSLYHSTWTQYPAADAQLTHINHILIRRTLNTIS